MTDLSGMPKALVVSSATGECEEFAARELQKYLKRMTGKTLPVRKRKARPRGEIALIVRRRETRPRLPLTEDDEAFEIHVTKDRIRLTGGTPRSLLYAVYAFLEGLGCRWIAPAFSFYRGIGHEVVPRLDRWDVKAGRRRSAPTFLYRRRNIEEARSNTIANTIQLIDWMAKTRMNALAFTIDYQHTGRFTWDKVRSRLAPELRKRGMIIEVGGHGYENFIHPEEFFDAHPEWFALVNGKRSDNPHHAFNTSNRAAMRLFVSRVVDYVEAHPDIDILDLWPNDYITWSTDPDSLAQGSPARRQAIITKAVRDAMRRKKLPVMLETISYSNHAQYPENFDYPTDVIVDLWPWWHEYRAPIFDPSELNARRSLIPFHDWAPKYKGVLGAGCYHMKYSWLSKPIVFPGVMWAEMSYYRDLGLQSIVTFGEPGSWLTYELTQYLFARLGWDASSDINAVVADYCRARFGDAAVEMEDYVWTLAKAAKRSCRLLYDHPDPLEREQGRVWIARCRALLAKSKRKLSGDRRRCTLIERLAVMLRHMDLTFDALAAAGPGRAREKRRAAVIKKIMRLARKHARDGIFLDVDGFWLCQTRLELFYNERGELLAPGEGISAPKKARKSKHSF